MAAVLVALAGGAWWLRSEHVPEEAKGVAQQFLRLLAANQFGEAHELTVEGGAIGRTPAELEAMARRELCRVDRVASTFPFQSNGNRLRRRFSGVEVEMPRVEVEFAGACLLGVTVERTQDKQWRVAKFAGHAG